MAIGFNPKYKQSVDKDGLSNAEFIALSIEVIKFLKWNISSISENGIVAFKGMSAFSWGERITIICNNEETFVLSESTGSELVDWGRNKKNTLRFCAAFQRIKSEIDADGLANKVAAMYEEIAERKLEAEEKHQIGNGLQQKGFLSLFIPSREFFSTPIFINLNILVYIIMTASGVHFFMPESVDLVKWGADYTPYTLNGEWWRLLTSIFVHGGLLHLLLNMYALLYIGILLEPIMGRWVFGLAYLLCGIFASVASLWWHPIVVSVGASGAIFGMYGVFLAMLTTNLIAKGARRQFLTSIFIFVSYNLSSGLNHSGIDNAAHVGGLISGIFIGYAFYPALKLNSTSNTKYLSMAGTALAIILISAFICFQMPADKGKNGLGLVSSEESNDIKIYQKDIQGIVALEKTAIESVNSIGDTRDSAQIRQLQDSGINNWDKALTLMNRLDKMHLPDIIHEKNKKLISYFQLRHQQYELIYKSYRENTEQYINQVKVYTASIDSITELLRNSKD